MSKSKLHNLFQNKTTSLSYFTSKSKLHQVLFQFKTASLSYFTSKSKLHNLFQIKKHHCLTLHQNYMKSYFSSKLHIVLHQNQKYTVLFQFKTTSLSYFTSNSKLNSLISVQNYIIVLLYIKIKTKQSYFSSKLHHCLTLHQNQN